MEKKQSTTKSDDQVKDDVPPADDKQDKTPKSPVEVAIAKASAEFERTGDVSEGTVEELIKMGIDKTYIQSYVEMARAADKRATGRNEGQSGLSEANVADVMSLAGGREGYESMLNWIQDTLDESEVEAYNNAMDSQNLDLIRATVKGYHARFAVANPPAPTHLQGKTGQGPSVEPFMSVDQVRRAMSDPKYKTDPAFRAEVTKRIAVSKVL